MKFTNKSEACYTMGGRISREFFAGAVDSSFVLYILAECRYNGLTLDYRCNHGKNKDLRYDIA